MDAGQVCTTRWGCLLGSKIIPPWPKHLVVYLKASLTRIHYSLCDVHTQMAFLMLLNNMSHWSSRFYLLLSTRKALFQLHNEAPFLFHFRDYVFKMKVSNHNKAAFVIYCECTWQTWHTALTWVSLVHLKCLPECKSSKCWQFLNLQSFIFLSTML